MGNDQDSTSHLFGSNAPYIEELYQIYINNPDKLESGWKQYFDDLADKHEDIEALFSATPWQPRKNCIVGQKDPNLESKSKKKAGGRDANVEKIHSIAMELIYAYRFYGHIEVNYDPLGIKPLEQHPLLHPEHYGLSDEDLSQSIHLHGKLGLEETTLSEVIDKARSVYSSRLGIEFMHIESSEERKWFRDRLESSSVDIGLEEQKKALFDLIEVESFEGFLHTKFPGVKRFSVEGCEASICATDKIIEYSANLGAEEVVIGMSHRGRLNTLTKVMGKPYHAMFAEFQGRAAHPDSMNIAGDVKYHLGASADIEVNGKNVHLSLTANPSHLEAVNSVVQGRVRAKQDQLEDDKREKVIGLLVHGDAAFSGQGSVFEALSLSGLKAYHTGGTVHIVANNQIGFTTLPKDSRATRYCTDMAKAISLPILHVNANDIEAVLFACKFATEYRYKFKKDIVIDIVGYRKYGHNEGDEPKFTQPLMYDAVSKVKSADVVFRDKLIAKKTIVADDYDKYKNQFKGFLDDEFKISQTYENKNADWLEGKWQGFEKAKEERKNEETGVKLSVLKKIGLGISKHPNEFNLNSKIARQLDTRKKMIEEGKGLDWGAAEALAFGSLLDEGYPVRITGQDAKRGTFSHRHAVLFDQKTENEYTPLNNLEDKQEAKLEVHNSNLSEFGVLGFEYGYSLTEPNCLTIWEAQFGDFANTAQVIIDQYITSGEAKWLRMNGLVMLLPHGYEGQGPEHSSARLERYLQMCAKDNMQVVNCTTPASIFHALRRQLHRKFRKPLVVMSPKSLLRHKLAVSDLSELSGDTHFKGVLGDAATNLVKGDKVKRVVVCSGKVYYDLYEAREKHNIKDVAILRIEQLYPFSYDEFVAELKKYKNAEVIWCQEEPKNMGPYFYVDSRLEKALNQMGHKNKRATYAGRDVSASPASGYAKQHAQEQEKLVNQALGIK